MRMLANVQQKTIQPIIEAAVAKPNLNTGFREDLVFEPQLAEFRDAWHYVWVAPDALAQRRAVSVETGRAA